MFADDRASELKVHCPLCQRVYTDPFISNCGVREYHRHHNSIPFL